MILEQTASIKGIDILKKSLIRLIPFASLSLLERLQSDFTQYINFLPLKPQIQQSHPPPTSISTAINTSITQILQSLKNSKTSIRIKSISYPDRYKSTKIPEKPFSDKPVAQHPTFNNQRVKHLPLMSMKWKQVHENKISREVVGNNVNVDSEGVALLATTIPKLQPSIDRINETRWGKREERESVFGTAKWNTERKPQSQRVNFQSEKRKRQKEMRSLEKEEERQREQEDKIFLKSYQVNRVPRNSYKIQRLI